MEIKIMSYEAVLHYQPPAHRTCSIIRILEPNEKQENLKYKERYKEILELHFHDVVESIGLPSDIRLFGSEEAKRVLEFFQNNRDIDILVIHCHAGISRSPAVALGMTWYLDDQEQEKAIIESDKYIQNQLVLKELAKALGKYEDKKDLIERLIPDDEEDFNKEDLLLNKRFC